MPRFPFFCDFITSLGSRVLFCSETGGPYQQVLLLPALSHLPSNSLSLSFCSLSLVTVGGFWEKRWSLNFEMLLCA